MYHFGKLMPKVHPLALSLLGHPQPIVFRRVTWHVIFTPNDIPDAAVPICLGLGPALYSNSFCYPWQKTPLSHPFLACQHPFGGVGYANPWRFSQKNTVGAVNPHWSSPYDHKFICTNPTVWWKKDVRAGSLLNLTQMHNLSYWLWLTSLQRGIRLPNNSVRKFTRSY